MPRDFGILVRTGVAPRRFEPRVEAWRSRNRKIVRNRNTAGRLARCLQ